MIELIKDILSIVLVGVIVTAVYILQSVPGFILNM